MMIYSERWTTVSNVLGSYGFEMYMECFLWIKSKMWKSVEKVKYMRRSRTSSANLWLSNIADSNETLIASN